MFCFPDMCVQKYKHMQNTNSNAWVIYRNALSHNARLLHTPWSSKLLHVFAEVTLSTLDPKAGLALSAACPSASGSRWAAVGWQLNSWWCCPHLGLRPVGRPLLEDKWSKWLETFCQWKETSLYLLTTNMLAAITRVLWKKELSKSVIVYYSAHPHWAAEAAHQER